MACSQIATVSAVTSGPAKSLGRSRERGAGHERYEELLRKANVLNEQFVDRRTRAVLRRNAEGKLMPTFETTRVAAPVVLGGEEASAAGAPAVVEAEGKPTIISVEDYTAQAQAQVDLLQVELVPKPDLPLLKIPRLKMGSPKSHFSLADIEDTDAFENFGRSIAADPEQELRRMRLSARLITGKDGLRRTELVTAPAVDRVKGSMRLMPLEEARDQLLGTLLSSAVVPARADERTAAAPLVQAFLSGLGEKAESVLGNYLDRAAAGLIALVTQEHRRFASKPVYEDVVELLPFSKMRTGKAEVSTDRTGAFKKSVGYEGYLKAMYVQDWFDSSTERAVANLVDDASDVQPRPDRLSRRTAPTGSSRSRWTRRWAAKRSPANAAQPNAGRTT